MITNSIPRKMKNYEIQIRRPKSFLNLGVLVLMTGLVLSSQQDGAAESGQLGKLSSGPVDELSAQHLNGNLVSFAPAVKKVSPAVVNSDLARRVMDDLVKYGYVVRGYLGVETQDLTPELAKEFKLHGAAGALVGGVAPNGPAEKAGLKVGDIIAAFDGREVRDARQLKLSVADAKPGQTVLVAVLRDGSAKPLRVTVGQASTYDFLAKTDPTAYEQDPGALQGVIIGELNSELRHQLNIPRNVQGALVFGVTSFSLAAQAGLRPGDVIQSINRQEVRNGGEASRLAQASRNKRLLLRVWTNGSSHFILVE